MVLNKKKSAKGNAGGKIYLDKSQNKAHSERETFSRHCLKMVSITVTIYDQNFPNL